MEKYGIDIESHTVHHENLRISKDKQLKTLTQSKVYLEKTLNKQINFFAYPNGGYNKSAVEALKETGYKMAFSTNEGWSSKHDGIFTLDRVWIGALDSSEVFGVKISNPNYINLAQYIPKKRSNTFFPNKKHNYHEYYKKSKKIKMLNVMLDKKLKQ